MPALLEVLSVARDSANTPTVGWSLLVMVRSAVRVNFERWKIKGARKGLA